MRMLWYEKMSRLDVAKKCKKWGNVIRKQLKTDTYKYLLRLDFSATSLNELDADNLIGLQQFVMNTISRTWSMNAETSIVY